jgi:hypothetical protein
VPEWEWLRVVNVVREQIRALEGVREECIRRADCRNLLRRV